jgi:hypothetical protein
MDNTSFPKHVLNYKPRGRIDRGRPRKRKQRVDAGTGQRPNAWRKMKMMFMYSYCYVCDILCILFHCVVLCIDCV